MSSHTVAYGCRPKETSPLMSSHPQKKVMQDASAHFKAFHACEIIASIVPALSTDENRDGRVWLMQGFVTLDSSGFIHGKGFCDTFESAPVPMWCISSLTPEMAFGLCVCGGGERHKEKSSNDPTQWMILSTGLTPHSSENNPHKHAVTCCHPTEKSIGILITSLSLPPCY